MSLRKAVVVLHLHRNSSRNFLSTLLGPGDITMPPMNSRFTMALQGQSIFIYPIVNSMAIPMSFHGEETRKSKRRSQR